jgi:hypothetical protein
LEVWKQAKSAFDLFAAMDAPDVPADLLSATQVRLCRWQVRNFGIQPDERIALGIIEEMGELSDAVSDEEVSDAFGDVCVYASQLCTSARLDFSTVMREVRIYALTDDYDPDRLMSAAGDLAHVVLKRSQSIRGFDQDDFYREKLFDAIVTAILVAMHKANIIDPDSVFTHVAESVMKRDWVNNPTDAAEKASEKVGN